MLIPSSISSLVWFSGGGGCVDSTSSLTVSSSFDSTQTRLALSSQSLVVTTDFLVPYGIGPQPIYRFNTVNDLSDMSSGIIDPSSKSFLDSLIVGNGVDIFTALLALAGE